MSRKTGWLKGIFGGDGDDKEEEKKADGAASPMEGTGADEAELLAAAYDPTLERQKEEEQDGPTLTAEAFAPIVALAKENFSGPPPYDIVHYKECQEFREVYNHGGLLIASATLYSGEQQLHRFSQEACALFDCADRGLFKARQEILSIKAGKPDGEAFSNAEQERIRILTQRVHYFAPLADSLKDMLPSGARVHSAPDDEHRGGYTPPELK